MELKDTKKQIWQIKDGRQLILAEKSLIVGVVNITPDSFSDGGLNSTPEKAIRQAKLMLADGADIFDIGGESTHPDAKPIKAQEEQRRLLPVISAFSRFFPDLPLSADTYRADTAEMALNRGAHIINDVSGLQGGLAMARLIAETGAGLILMHTGRKRQKHSDPLEDQRLFFAQALDTASKAGIKQKQIVLDPGFGFAKTEAENVALLRHAEILRNFGLPLLAGTSRKGFLGKITGQTEPCKRDGATAATSVILRLAGFSLFRVHNIALTREVLSVADRVCAVEQK